MARSIYPYPPGTSLTSYFVTFILYISLAAALIFFTVLIEKLLINNKARLFFFFILILLIALFTFDAGFPITGHDYSFIYGTLWEIAHGKTIYTETPSLYGFGSNLVFTLLYKIRRLGGPRLSPFLPAQAVQILAYRLGDHIILIAVVPQGKPGRRRHHHPAQLIQQVLGVGGGGHPALPAQ